MTRRAPSHRGRTVALCAAAALFVAAAPAFAQQDDGGASKRGGRIRIGGGVLGGDLTFRGSQFPELGRDDVRIDTAITGAPSLRFGLLYFFDRPFAVDIDATVGFAEIAIPGALDKAGAQPKLRLFPWGVRSHFVYRWRTSGSPCTCPSAPSCPWRPGGATWRPSSSERPRKAAVDPRAGAACPLGWART